MKNQISVIIPTLNEKKNITILINKLLDINNIEDAYLFTSGVYFYEPFFRKGLSHYDPYQNTHCLDIVRCISVQLALL